MLLKSNKHAAWAGLIHHVLSTSLPCSGKQSLLQAKQNIWDADGCTEFSLDLFPLSDNIEIIERGGQFCTFTTLCQTEDYECDLVIFDLVYGHNLTISKVTELYWLSVVIKPSMSWLPGWHWVISLLLTALGDLTALGLHVFYVLLYLKVPKWDINT